MKNKASLVLIFMALVFATPLNFAQERTQKTITTLMSFGDWLVRCEQIDDELEPCTMSQKILNQETKQTLIEANLAKNGDAIQLTLVFPLGIYLPKGAELQVVGWGKRQYEYSFCSNAGCFVNELLDKEIVELLRKKDKATLTLYASQDEKVNLPLSIIGFLDAFKKL